MMKMTQLSNISEWAKKSSYIYSLPPPTSSHTSESPFHHKTYQWSYRGLYGVGDAVYAAVVVAGTKKQRPVGRVKFRPMTQAEGGNMERGDERVGKNNKRVVGSRREWKIV